MLLRVRAETCGLRPLRGQTGSAPDSLSSGHFSQYPRPPEMGRSPQGSLSMAKKINNLRVDESIGLFAALVGDQKSQPSGFGCGGLRKAGAGQKQTPTDTFLMSPLGWRNGYLRCGIETASLFHPALWPWDWPLFRLPRNSGQIPHRPSSRSSQVVCFR